MKKFIKINLIILVIVYLSCSLPVNILATSERNFDFLTIPEDALDNIDGEYTEPNGQEEQNE